MKYPKLYKTVKSGRKQVWKIWTDGPNIYHTFGFLDGKMRDPVARKCEPKNTGKANATTASEQADKEALAKWKKQLEKGYEPECEKGKELAEKAAVQKKKTGSNKISGKAQDPKKQILVDIVEHNTKIMKGKKYDEITREITPGYVQHKFNGVRCKASLQEDGVAMTTSSGKQFVFIEHIKDALKTALKKWETKYDQKLTLDGECYKHGEPLQIITACCRSTRSSPHEREKEMEYYIFDIDIPGMKQTDRLKILRKFFKKCVTDDMPLVLAETFDCDGTKESLYKYLIQFEEDGYEGVIFRFPEGLYNTKSLHVDDVFKYKSFIDDEFEIIGAKEGKGTEAGKVIFRCKNENGEFDVRMMGTKEDCIKMYQNRKKYIGKMLTVRYQEMSPKGIPFHLRGLAVRDYE
jgi:ATP-dependent DNA ligase